MTASTYDTLRLMLQTLVSKTDGLLAVIISDREGIALAKCISEDAPEMASRSQFLSCYQSVADQASKMGIGVNSHVVAYYHLHQLVMINQSPAVLTLLAQADANTSLLLDAARELDPFMPAVRSLVERVGKEAQ